MNLQSFDEERKVIGRIADWHEYHFFGIPAGIFRDWKKHGFKRAIKHYFILGGYDNSRLASEYREMWRGEEKEHYQEVRSGEESGYYRFQHPVDFELDKRRVHKSVTSLLAGMCLKN